MSNGKMQLVNMKMLYINELARKKNFKELISRILDDFSKERPISFGFSAIPELQDIIISFKKDYDRANSDARDQLCIILGIVYGECIRAELGGKWFDKLYNGGLYIEFPKSKAAGMFNPINCIASFFAGETRCLLKVADMAKGMAEKVDNIADRIIAARRN